jgi:hypothetical protein
VGVTRGVYLEPIHGYRVVVSGGAYMDQKVVNQPYDIN